MASKLGYAIRFVADRDRAVALYRDAIGLELKFSSPGWSEFETGATTLALHPASAEKPPAARHLGRHADDIMAVHGRLGGAGLRFTRNRTPEHGVMLAEFASSEGARVSLSG